jgi:predicted Zn-dependent protease
MENGERIPFYDSSGNEDVNAFVVFLYSGGSFRYEPEDSSLLPISVRREQRGNESYWYGYLRREGHLRKEYIGKSAAPEHLERVARLLNSEPEPKRRTTPAKKLRSPKSVLPNRRSVNSSKP